MAPLLRRVGPADHRGPARPLALTTRWTRLPLLPLLTLLLAACGDDPTPPTPDPVPATIEILSGDAQRAVQGLPLEERIAVRVLDDASRPLSGAAITFTPSAGGQADSASVATDDGGRASAIWVLGPDPGEQSLTVSSGNASARVTAESLDLEAELGLLFVPPTQAEIDAVLADWAGRSAPAEDVRVELSEDFSLGGSDANLRVVSHVVTGLRHYGAIVTPAGAEDESLPILVYLHGGENGVSVADVQIAALGLGEDLLDRFVYVLPSYRAEPLRHGDMQWVSEGTSSHWDYDVDDVIALVNVAFETTPEAKPGGYNLLGGSRGGGVALLAGIRDERVERIVSFFGPTDFFDTWVREIVREAALQDTSPTHRGRPPGLHDRPAIPEPGDDQIRGAARTRPPLIRPLRGRHPAASGPPRHHRLRRLGVAGGVAHPRDGGAGARAARLRGLHLRVGRARLPVARRSDPTCGRVPVPGAGAGGLVSCPRDSCTESLDLL